MPRDLNCQSIKKKGVNSLILSPHVCIFLYLISLLGKNASDNIFGVSKDKQSVDRFQVLDHLIIIKNNILIKKKKSD